MIPRIQYSQYSQTRASHFGISTTIFSFTRQGTGISLNKVRFRFHERLIEAGNEGDEVAAALYDIGQIAKTPFIT